MGAAAAALAPTVIAGSAGGIVGYLQGKRGTPDQREFQTSRVELEDALSRPERLQLEADITRAAAGDLDASRRLQESIDARIQGLDPLQAQAQQSLSDIIAGRSFQVSPEEQRLIEAQRQAQISLGEQDINKFLDERLQQVVGSAAGRGLRGQALGELQSDVIKQGSEAQARLVGQANLSALQQAQNLPFQRVAAQQPAISQGFTTADILRQQAFANRQALSSPDLLRQLQQERFAKATRVNESFTPGRQGSTLDGLIGGIQGGLGGAAAGQSIGQGIAGASKPKASTPNNSGLQDPRYGSIA